MQSIVLIESRMTGHRPSYLRRISEIAMARGIKVVIAMPPACFEHPVVVQLFATGCPGKLHAVHCQFQQAEAQPSKATGMLVREFQHRSYYQRVIKKVQKNHSIDVAVIGMFDDVSMLSGIIPLRFGRLPWVGFVMRQKFHFQAMGARAPTNKLVLMLKRIIFICMLRQIGDKARILTIDESLNRFITTNNPSLKQRITYVPDPVDNRRQVTSLQVRAELRIPEDAFVILAYGTLRKGKGVELLLNVMHELPDNVHALLVGNQSPEISDCVNSKRHCQLFINNRIHQVDRYIDVSEDPNFFSAANAVWLCYQNYYAMSAVMVQAAQYERPTIATSNGLIGTLTKRFKTGYLVDTTITSEVVKGVFRLLRNEFTVEERNYAEFARAHSLSVFEELLMKSLKEVTAR